MNEERTCRINEVSVLLTCRRNPKNYELMTLAATDKQIDQLVYELYGLTEDEIRIVEGN